ncbi:MAG: fumarate hydratase [Clostridiales bacterium]|nr:fumarate hydratase [Clostridiales bacterium]
MRNIDCVAVRQKVAALIERCLIEPDGAVTEKLENISDAPLATFAAKLIAENNRIAKEKRVFACQDTGQALLIVRLGDEAYCPGLFHALEDAVRTAYSPARKSVADPLTRLNTKDNTPPIIETELVPGDALEISFLAKGAGSENMAKLYMLKPADGEDGIISSVVDAVNLGGRNACPPLVVGVGIGGVAETACMLSKRALLRPIGSFSPREDVARLEKIALEKVNALGIGVAAFGGSNTALAVNIEVAPTHIGMLPVAVNLQCHSLRHGTVTL